MIDTLYKIVAFAITLGVLVVFHELGHYVIARLAGVKVLRFSVGFGSRVWSRRLGRDGTEWALSAIPLGGYVKMLDEREGHVDHADLPRAFNRQSVWRRIAIVAAGPLANLLLAVLLFAGTYVAGIPGQRALLAEPPASTAAATADVRAGDRVVAVDGEPVGSWQELRWRIVRAQGQDTVTLALAREDDAGAPVVRELSLAGMDADAWEGSPLAALGLRADLGAPIVDQVLPGKPAERAGLRSGDRIVAVDGKPMRSPADVAALTNAHPGDTLSYRVQRADATLDVPVAVESVDQNGRRVGLAGVRLRIDPEVAERASVIVRYGLGESLVQGARKTWELSAFTLAHAGQDRHRRRVAEEHQRAVDDGRHRRPVRAGGNAGVRRLSRADQHQPRRAEPVAGSATGWRAFTVLSRRNYQGQSRIRPRIRGRSAHRHGDARRPDGPGAFQ